MTVDTATNGGPEPTAKVELRVGDKVMVADVANSWKVVRTCRCWAPRPRRTP